MSTKTQNYNLTKPEESDYFDVAYQGDNMEIIDAELKNINNKTTVLNTHLTDYKMQIPWSGTSTNIGNAYYLATPVISSLVEGMAVSFKCNADATGAVTLNWAGTGDKSVLKANGSPVVNWKNGGVYTLRYDGINFWLQGEGGDYGNVLAKHVTQGIIFGTEHGLDVGTNTNKPWTIKDLGTITVPGNGQLVFTFDFEPTYVIIIYDIMSGPDKAWINIVLSKNQDLNTTTHGWTAKQKGFITYENPTQGSTNTSLINPTFTSNSVMFSYTALFVLNNVRVIAF